MKDVPVLTTVEDSPAAAPPRLSPRQVRSTLNRDASWPAVFAATAFGILLIGVSYRLSAQDQSPDLYYATFWFGVLVAVLPICARMTMARSSRADRAWTILLLGLVTAVPKYLRNPDQPLYHDEYAHWREAIDVLSSGQLLRPNALIPIVQFFPGTSGLTATIQRLTGLSVWTSGQLLIGAAHVLGLFAVFLLVEAQFRSARAGAIGAIVYALNPSAMYFDTQYAYESLAINLFLWVLALASIARRAPTRRRQFGYTVAAVLCAGGCVVTHHLTTVFLITVLVIICASISIRQLRRVRAAKKAGAPRIKAGIDLRVWWTVLGSTVVLAALWLFLIAWPTVSYLSPYFGGSVEQLTEIATTENSQAGRQLLAASAQPLWERALTAIAPVALGVICLFAVVAIWRERRRWPTATLGLMIFGLVYFPSVPFVLAPSGAEGARRSWGFTYIGIALIVTFIALHRPKLPTRRLPRLSATAIRHRYLLSTVMLLVLLIGNVGGGLNDPYRFPGPFRWGSDTDSASDETRAVAKEMSALTGPVRIVTDAYTALQFVSYGGMDVAAPSTGFPAWDLTQTNTDPPPALAKMLAESGYNFLVVDTRMAAEPAFNGSNFGSGIRCWVKRLRSNTSPGWTRFRGRAGSSPASTCGCTGSI